MSDIGQSLDTLAALQGELLDAIPTRIGESPMDAVRRAVEETQSGAAFF